MFDLEKRRQIIGKSIGTSNWLTITQQMLNQFAEVTLDPDPMHIDPKWCNENSPYNNTIAFGFLTVSLLTHFVQDVTEYDRFGTSETTGFPLNYGFDRLRLLSPIPVNSRIRAHFIMKDITEKNPGEYLQVIAVSVEIEGQEKPALIADWLGLWVQGGSDKKIPGKSEL